MIINILRYIVSLIALSAIGLVAVDSFFIPRYVGVDADVFLPDCRGKTKNAAEQILFNKGLETKVIPHP